MAEAHDGLQVVQRHPELDFIVKFNAQCVVFESQVRLGRGHVKGVEKLHSSFRRLLRAELGGIRSADAPNVSGRMANG